jgi:hypothetical protein
MGDLSGRSDMRTSARDAHACERRSAIGQEVDQAQHSSRRCRYAGDQDWNGARNDQDLNLGVRPPCAVSDEPDQLLDPAAQAPTIWPCDVDAVYHLRVSERDLASRCFGRRESAAR